VTNPTDYVLLRGSSCLPIGHYYLHPRLTGAKVAADLLKQPKSLI
jgi:hypothetical protein